MSTKKKSCEQYFYDTPSSEWNFKDFIRYNQAKYSDKLGMLKVWSGPVLVRSYEVPGAGQTRTQFKDRVQRTQFKDPVPEPGPQYDHMLLRWYIAEFSMSPIIMIIWSPIIMIMIIRSPIIMITITIVTINHKWYIAEFSIIWCLNYYGLMIYSQI